MNLIPWHSKRTGDEEPMTAADVRREIARAMDRLMEEPFGRWPFGGGLLGRMGGAEAREGPLIPPLDITEDEREVVIKAELPGVEPKDVEVSISGNTLTLSGHKEESSEDKGKGYFRSERSFGTFMRRIDLPEFVDPDKVSADFERGVLRIRLGKKAGAPAKRIPVNVGAQRAAS